MSSTVNEQHPGQATEPRMSTQAQLALLKEDLWALHEELTKITRPELADNPTPSPIEAMRMYVGSGNALKLNRYLRGQRTSLSEALGKMNAGMQAFFESHSRTLQTPLILRRWVFSEGDYSPAHLAPSAVVTERGWLSLTTDSSHGFFTSQADVECEVTLPIGSRILAGAVYENEFILRPNSTFEVKQVIDADAEVDGKMKFLLRLHLL